MKTNKTWRSMVVTVAFVLGMMVIVIAFIAYWNVASNPIVIYSYSKNIPLSNSNGSSLDPQIAANEKGDVYVVWIDETTGNGDIYFRSSSDNGSTFDATIDLSNNSGVSFWPKIYAIESNAYVLWVDNSTGNKEIYFKRISDNGSSVTTLINISNSTGSSSDPQIAATEKGDVYVVWRDETTGNGDIYFRKSTDYGDTFKSTKNLRGNNGSSSDPQIVSSSDSVSVLWNESKNNNSGIYFQTIQGDAPSFDNSTNLNENHSMSHSPRIYATGNNIYVVWIDKVNPKNSYVQFKHINIQFLG